ncbi:MAG: TetR family transcriptional regulator [Kofleriaceae bacterium]
MSTPGFQRAREPEQKEQRRRELLEAAATLLRDGGLEAVSLSAIARAAGVAKSNVYRYFESREEILLEILVEDEQAWVSDLERLLAPLAGRGQIKEVAELVARSIAARPLTCELISVVAAVLEHNLSLATVTQFKARVLEVSIRIRNALHAALPQLPHEHSEALLRYLHALVAGLWPMAHPAPAASEAMEQLELRGLCSEFAVDLAGALSAMMLGLARPR